MSHAAGDLRPRISLGVTHVKQHLEEMVAELQEPIAITVEGKRAAVLVPYGRYLQMLSALAAAEEQPSPEEQG